MQSEIRLDGVLVFESTDQGRLRGMVEVVHDASATPGRHEVTAFHRLTGHGVGALSYLNNYRFTVPSKHSLSVLPVGGTCTSLTLYFRGDDSMPLEERPTVRHDDESGATTAR